MLLCAGGYIAVVAVDEELSPYSPAGSSVHRDALYYRFAVTIYQGTWSSAHGVAILAFQPLNRVRSDALRRFELQISLHHCVTSILSFEFSKPHEEFHYCTGVFTSTVVQVAVRSTGSST